MLDASAIEQRDAAIGWAQLVTAVDSPEQLTDAVANFRELKAIKKGAEDCRVSVKAPVLTLQRAIDEKAKEFVSPVDLEIQRLDRLITGFERRQEEARRKAEQERQALLKKAADEEAARLKQIEAQRQAELKAAMEKAAAEAAVVDPLSDGPAPAAVAVVTAQVDVVAAQQALAVVDEARAARMNAIISTAPALVTARPAGMTTRREPKFRMTDALAFANSRPDLVTIEPKTREILAEIRKRPEFDGEVPGGPGIVVWWEGKVVVR